MDYYTKNSITNIAIISSLFLTITIIFLCSWQPFTYKPLFFSRNHLSLQKDELQIALEKASMPNKTVIIAIINKAYVEANGNEYPSMFDLFLEGFWAGDEIRPLVDHLLVVAMDETALERCKFRRLNCYGVAAVDGGEKVYMTEEFIEMMWRRTGFLLDVLNRGFDFIFTDTDVLWLRNPFTQLDNNQTLDLQISTDIFNGDPSSERNLINTGFYFIRSNKRTILFFEKWYDMRKNSTGLKEQDVLENLVRGGELRRLEMSVRFLDTLYFSGFCSESGDVESVITVHANCCRSIRAKVADLKTVFKDWKRFKSKISVDVSDLRENRRRFRWSRHVSCINSWNNRTLT